MNNNLYQSFLTRYFGQRNAALLKLLTTKYPLSIGLILAFVYPIIAQQDLRLSGLVVQQNSAYRTGKVAYVSGAFVRAPLSTPTASDANGRFTLVFADKPTGDMVNVTVRKAGLEVVNRKEVENAAVLGRLSPLKIVMSSPDDLDDARAAYYEISRSRANQIYENRLSALKKESKTRQRLLDSLSKEFNRTISTSEEAQLLLVQQRNQLQKQAQELAERFVVINLDDESDTYRRAFKLFTEGEVEKAVQLLDNLNLTKRLADNTTIVAKSANIITEAEKIIMETQAKRAKATEQIRDDIRHSLLNAQLHRALFQFSKANENYALVVHYDSTTIDYLNEYTQFLWDYGEYRLALDINRRALSNARARVQSGDSLGVRRELAYALYYRQLLMKVDGKKDSLKLACAEAMPLLQNMVEQDSAHLFVFVEVMANLAQAYWMNNDALSMQLYQRAFQLLPAAVSPRYENAYLFDKSFVLTGISGGFQDMKQLDNALRYGEQAVLVGKQLLQKDTFRYAIQLAKMLNNLAAVYEDSERYNEAIATLREAKNYIGLVAALKPKESNREIARIHLSLFYNYLLSENENEAENQLNEAQRLAENERAQGENNPQLLEGIWTYRRRLVISLESIKQPVKALRNAEKNQQLLPAEDRTKALLGATLIFNNQYDKALMTFKSITDTNEINKMLLLFEKNLLKHADFAKIRTQFKLK